MIISAINLRAIPATGRAGGQARRRVA